jgi:hypothetical protein
MAFAHIPGSTYNAALKSELFRNCHGAPIPAKITTNLLTRPPVFYYFTFCFAVKPATLDTHISLPASTLEFCLALPHTALPGAASTPTSGCHLFPSTTPHLPTTPKSPTPALLTATNLHALFIKNFTLLGTSTGTDALSEYAANCFPIFTDAQLCTLVLRGHAPTPVAADIIVTMSSHNILYIVLLISHLYH